MLEKRDDFIRLRSLPFISELKMYQPASNATLIFTDNSFIKYEVDEYDGNYYHKSGAPTDKLWMRLDTDVDPGMDEVFTSGNSLRPATMYTCRCKNYSTASWTTQQETQDESTRRVNKQR